jgi:carboxyl-terminal processing protease
LEFGIFIYMSLKTLRNISLGLSLLIFTFGVGYSVGVRGIGTNLVFPTAEVTGKAAPKVSSVNFSLFWDVWDRLFRLYLDKKALDAQKMVYGAISGMVVSLGDPYTVFLPPDQNKEAKDDLGGKFEGIGAQLGIKDKKIVVVAPLKESPAAAAGLRPGDWIIKVDDKETLNWTIYEAVSKIRGPKGSKVSLSIMHKNASKSAEITVVRDEIKVASVEWEEKNVQCNNATMQQCKEIKEGCANCEKIVYLKLTRFGDQTSDEWNKAVGEINQVIGQSSNLPAGKAGQAIKGLVFDLRNNPGGYLSGSVFIASEFLADGTVVIQESAGGVSQKFTVNRKGKLLSIPMVVLINKGSASASEIVAGALKERNRAKLVGETTFGKGSIQEAQDLSGGAGIHITTAKWLLPSGKWINGSGVEPDVAVANDEAKPEEDLQLEKAIEVLVK